MKRSQMSQGLQGAPGRWKKALETEIDRLKVTCPVVLPLSLGVFTDHLMS
jgi:hypothetical protein